MSLSALIRKPRSAKQCRERWHNYLDPSVTQSEWSIEEQSQVFHLNAIFGNKWAEIASLIPGRRENSVKNLFYSTVRKNVRRVNKLSLFPTDIKGNVDDLKKDDVLNYLLFCNSEECLEKARALKRFYKGLSENMTNQEILYNEWIEDYDRLRSRILEMEWGFSEL